MTDFPIASDAGVPLPELVMHFREGCHLCEDMQQQLKELFEPDEFRLTLIDIDEDEHLREAYNVRVPVLSLVPLQVALANGSAVQEEGSGALAGTDFPGSEQNRPKNGALKELCEHFLDLVAVREALASYNKPLLVACSQPADR